MWEHESRADPHLPGPCPTCIPYLHPSEDVKMAQGLSWKGSSGSLKAGPQNESALEVSLWHLAPLSPALGADRVAADKRGWEGVPAQ